MEYLNWIIEHKYIVVGIATVLGLLVAFSVGVVGAFPDNETLKNWTMQEAVFYGFCVLAIATYLK